MRLSIVVAMTRNRIIGKAGGMPWRLSSDLRRFKQLTMGHHIIMGRATYDSIGRPLPGRTTIVLSRQAGLVIPGVAIASSLASALEMARDDSEVFLVGGGQVYALGLAQAQRLYVTLVDAEIEGDTWFPPWDPSDWELVLDEPIEADEKNNFPTRFRIYDRRVTPLNSGAWHGG